MSRIAYVNGSFVPLEEAKVSILDRGFLFADGIYEVSAVLGGKLVDNDSHLLRLQRSVGEIALPLPETLDRIKAIQKELIARNNLVDGLVYLQVTRGAAERDFPFPKEVTPTLVMFTTVKDIINAPAAKTGIAVKTVPDIRWERRDIKSVALLAQVLAKQAAAEAGCQEAWMIEDGAVTEGGPWRRTSASPHETPSFNHVRTLSAPAWPVTRKRARTPSRASTTTHGFSPAAASRAASSTLSSSASPSAPSGD